MTNLFFNDNHPAQFAQLRPGWRFLLYLLALMGLIACTRPLMSALRLGAGYRGLLAGEAAFFAVVVLVSLVFAKLEGRPWGAFGLPRRGAFGQNFCTGLAWGPVALALLLLLIRACGGFSFGRQNLSGASALAFAAAWGLFFLLVAFAEEFSFRGYPLFTLTNGMGFWGAAILLSVLFGAVHLQNPGEDWMGGLSAGLIGLFFCFTLLRTGSLWFAVGLHAGWDWAESYLFGVPDSGLVVTGHLLTPSFHGSKWLTGGAVGPEGSVFVLVVIALLFLLFHFLFPAPAARPLP